MKIPYKAYIKVIYDDCSEEECEIDPKEAMKYFDHHRQSAFIQSVDTGQCSRRIGHYIQIIALTAEYFIQDKDKNTTTAAFAKFKKYLTSSIKALAEAEGVRYPTLEDQVCRQMQQGKDQLTARVLQFFHSARTESAEAAVNEPDSLYRYVVENGFLSEKVAYNSAFNEQEHLRQQLLKVAKKINEK